MKKISILFFVASLATAGTSFAERYGELISQGENCGIVKVESATLFSGSGEKRMELQFSIADDGRPENHDKRIWLQRQDNHQGSEAVWSNHWWQYSVAAKFEFRNEGRVYFRLTNQMVGPSDLYSLMLYVTMNNAEYACTNILVGVQP